MPVDMLMTFFTVPFFSSGKNAFIVFTTPMTLISKDLRKSFSIRSASLSLQGGQRCNFVTSRSARMVAHATAIVSKLVSSLT